MFSNRAARRRCARPARDAARRLPRAPTPAPCPGREHDRDRRGTMPPSPRQTRRENPRDSAAATIGRTFGWRAWLPGLARRTVRAKAGSQQPPRPRIDHERLEPFHFATRDLRAQRCEAEILPSFAGILTGVSCRFRDQTVLTQRA